MKTYNGLNYNDDFTICTGLNTDIKHIKLHPNTKKISDGAFMCKEMIEKVTFNKNLEEIGAYAFYDTSLKVLDLSNNEKIQLKNNAFSESIPLHTVKLNKNINFLPSLCFYKCLNLRKIDISKTSIKTLGSSCFMCCPNLKEIILPKTLLTIDSYTFYGCFSLLNINLPDNLIRMGLHVFDNTKIKEIYLPDSLKYISEYNETFLDSANIETVYYNNLDSEVFEILNKNKRITFKKTDLMFLLKDNSFKEINQIFKERNKK